MRSVWEALARGYRIGFVGSGDTHWLGPGEDYGITGAYVKQLTREGLFEAIRKRRVFASTGPHLLLDFRVNGRIEIFRDDRVIYAGPYSGASASVQYVDQAVNPERGKWSYYYARVTRQDGMKAWSSPVWVDWE